MKTGPDIGSVLRRVLLLSMAAASAPLAGCSSPASHANDAGPACGPALLDASITDTDAGAECYAYERLACGMPAGIKPDDAGCSFPLADCKKLCKSFGAFECHADKASCVDGAVVDSGVTLMCSFCSNSAGRRPRGLCAAEPLSAGSALGDYFARAAHLEAAAVPAFRALRRALRRLGAPEELQRRALCAAREEVRHARIMRRLAARHGAEPAPVRVEPGPAAGLEALATDNAVEGMVRETLGALVASWQAEHAYDAETRRAMRDVALEETRHAALSWEIARWAAPLLDPATRRRVGAAAREEARRLAADIAEPHPVLVRDAGLPRATAQRALLRGLERELWAAF